MIVGDGLPSLELNFDDFVAHLLAKAHVDTLGLFIKLKTTLIQECLNVFELCVVVIFVLDLLLEGLAQLLGSISKLISGEAARGSGGCHESWLLFCH